MYPPFPNLGGLGRGTPTALPTLPQWLPLLSLKTKEQWILSCSWFFGARCRVSPSTQAFTGAPINHNVVTKKFDERPLLILTSKLPVIY